MFVGLIDESYALVRRVDVTLNECKLDKDVCQLRGVCFLGLYGDCDGGMGANESSGGFHVEESRAGGLDLSGKGRTLKGALWLEGLLMVREETVLVVGVESELPIGVKYDHDQKIISTCGNATAVLTFIIIKVITEMRNKNFSSSNPDTEDDKELERKLSFQ